MAMPEYTDGVLELLRIEEDNLQDFPLEKVRSTGMHIWYRELSVFDTTRAKLSADGIEVTMKISIPQYKQVNSKYVKVIYDGADGLTVRKSPSWDASAAAGTVKKNEVFTVIQGPIKVGSGSMYKLKSGLYITASSKYVSVFEK